MNLLTGWDNLYCDICGKKFGRLYVSDDYALEFQCNDCIPKEDNKK